MKIKKKTSIMMLAASTAAVVGVAAVSYAAWQGGAYTTTTASASTGEAYLFGFETEQKDNVLKFKDQALVPFDQGASAKAGTSTVIVSDAIPDFTVYQGYAIKLDGLKMMSKDSVEVSAGFSVYAQVGTFADGNPTVDADTWTTENPGDWELISDTDGFSFAQTFTAGTNTVSGMKIALMLVSDAANADAAKQMGATISFSVTLVNGNA